NSWVVLYPQFVNPALPAVLDLDFRRALLHAIDRQEMVNTLMGGLVPIAHGPLNPQTAEYKATEASLLRYDFDPRRTAQLLANLGYTRGADGVVRDTREQSV